MLDDTLEEPFLLMLIHSLVERTKNVKQKDPKKKKCCSCARRNFWRKKNNNTTQWLNDCMFKRLVEPNRKQDVDANQDAETTDVDVIEWEKPVMLVNVSHARTSKKEVNQSLPFFTKYLLLLLLPFLLLLLLPLLLFPILLNP